MNVTENTVKSLDGFLIEHQEADIVTCLAEKMSASAEEALLTYYRSDLAPKIEQGKLGIQYLPPEYIADEILKWREGPMRPREEQPSTDHDHDQNPE